MKTILEIYTKIFTNRRGGYTGRRRARRIRAVTHGTFCDMRVCIYFRNS